MYRPRILPGVATMLAIQVCAEPLLSASPLGKAIDPTAQALAIAFVAAAASGAVARRDFILPALTLWLALWGVVLGLLYAVAAPLDPAALPALLRTNAWAIAFTAVATTLGAASGAGLAHRRWQ